MTREQSRDLTQQKLRASALREFAITGFSGASIDRICEAAGFSRGAFYANYKNKHELMLELMREMSALEVERWRALILAHGANKVDFGASVARRFEAFLRETPWALFAVEAQLQARRDAEFAAQHRVYLSDINVNIKELLAMTFLQAGQAVPDDLELLSHMFYSLSLGLFLSTDPDCPNTGARVAGDALARFYRGLLLPG